MKILYIGGTGNISTASSHQALNDGIELWHLNRGKAPAVSGTRVITCDINDPAQARQALANHEWDCVVNWIAFTPEQVQRDLELFTNRTRQYIFISSASCYQTPLENPFITERTPLSNPFWQYSRNKIACEELLMKAFRDTGFPATIVRPSHTYSNVIPIPIGGWTEYTTVDRIKKGLPIVVHGDGSSLWVLTHAEDFARGFNGLLGNEEAIGEAIHITSDEVLTWNQIHQQLAAAVGATADIVHVTSDKICRFDPEYVGSLLGDKSASVIFDNSKIKGLVPGFKATIPFAEGIKRTIAWFDAEPSRQAINPADNEFIDRLIASERKD
jgi:nucleoside-diphosphate-sugar epimerase